MKTEKQIAAAAAEFAERWRGRGLCLSQEQNDAFFCDFVWQYYSAIYWGNKPAPIINTDIPLF